MIQRRVPNPFAASLLLVAAVSNVRAQTGAPASAQPVPQPPQAAPATPKPVPTFYRNVILLDPAHGGPDTGAKLPDNVMEKDVSLALVQRLRPALATQGFTVVSTRDSDPGIVLTSDQRAGIANHLRPLACILLHATATGSGIHVASSSLTPPSDAISPSRALAWDRAQAPTVPMSLRLANEIGLAISDAHLPVILMRASMPPIDNLICPSVAIELAPLVTSSGIPSPVTDPGYQRRVVEAVAAALASFRTPHAPPPAPQAIPGLGTSPANPGAAK